MSSCNDKPLVVLTIAGFDPSSGAGVTADLKVFAAHDLFGTAAITTLTAQSTRGVFGVSAVPSSFLHDTLKRLLEDLSPDGIKIGMLGSAEAVQVVSASLRDLSDVRDLDAVPIVLDPVMRSSSGVSLLESDALTAMRSDLLPIVSWITPNLQELHVLAELKADEMRASLEALGRAYPQVEILATGGDADGDPTDYWRSSAGEIREFVGARVATRSTHGTGCALSSALLCQLVRKVEPQTAIARAKHYVEEALRRAPGIGEGAGPLHLMWPKDGLVR